MRQFDQYVVKVDGSGRVTLRNRKFLRKYVPVKPSEPTVTIDQDLLLEKLCSQRKGGDFAANRDITISSPPVPQPVVPSPIRSDQEEHPSCTPTILTTQQPPPITVDTRIKPRRLTFSDNSPRPLEDKPTTPTPKKSEPRRSGRESRPPAWHSDYDMN